MRYMGIDYGAKRVGIALTDEGGSMAFPHTTLAAGGALLKELERIIGEKKVGAIVIGHSLTTKGEENMIQKSVNELVLDLTLGTGLPVHLEPEWFSSIEAMRFQTDRGKKDESAAALILERFLAKKK